MFQVGWISGVTIRFDDPQSGQVRSMQTISGCFSGFVIVPSRAELPFRPKRY